MEGGRERNEKEGEERRRVDVIVRYTKEMMLSEDM